MNVMAILKVMGDLMKGQEGDAASGGFTCDLSLVLCH
jgi:hypothetical protein